MELTNAQINDIMVEYPDLVAEAEKKYKTARVEADRAESLAYFRLKAQTAGQEVTEAWLKHKVRADDEVHQVRLNEVVLESEYNRLYEKLMCAKKLAALRTAY